MLENLIRYIENEENDKIENIIQVIYKRFRQAVGFLDDDFKKMLGVFYYSFIAYGLENELLPSNYKLPANLIEYNPIIEDIELDTNNNYEMLILGLYNYFKSFEEPQTDELVVEINNQIIIDDEINLYYKVA